MQDIELRLVKRKVLQEVMVLRVLDATFLLGFLIVYLLGVHEVPSASDHSTACATIFLEGRSDPLLRVV